MTPDPPRAVVLSGGLGGARLALGLRDLDMLEQSRIVVNVADDVVQHGLRVCPDLDTVMYALADLLDHQRGWGLVDETFAVMDAMAVLDEPQWFNLGDRDLATHLLRTSLLASGATVSTVTEVMCERLGLPPILLPVTDDDVRTRVTLEGGDEVDFQSFHVRLRSQPRAVAVRHVGIDLATPVPGLLDAIRDAELVVIAPSSPVASILPQLDVAGVRTALQERHSATVAISPVVLGRAATGGAAHRARTRERLMAAIGVAHRPDAVARLYAGVIDAFVIDRSDADQPWARMPPGVEQIVAETITPTGEGAARLLQELWAELV